MKYIELFAGIGGFRYGLESIKPQKLQGEKLCDREDSDRVESTKREQPDFTCVYANEFNKYAAQIYERNFNAESTNRSKNRGSQENTTRDQGQGLQPTKGKEISTKKRRPSEHSYIRSKQGTVNSVDTRDIREVNAEELPDFELLTAGFPCQSFSIAGKRGGFKDTRGTLFFEIARIAKQKQPRLLLLENVKGLLSHDKGQTFATILNTLDELGYDLQWQVLNSKNFGVPQNRERVFIIGHLRGTSRPEVFPLGENDKVSVKRQGQVSPTITQRYYKQGQSDPYIFNESTPSIRRLTPTECERLQGFPDGWTKGVSDTQRYKCLGNAVTTNVITAIGKKLW